MKEGDKMTNYVLIGVGLNIGFKLLKYEKVRAREMCPSTQSSQCMLGEILFMPLTLQLPILENALPCSDPRDLGVRSP